MDLNRSDLLGVMVEKSQNESLTSESVEGTSLTFQGIDDIHGGDSLPLGVLGVGDGVSDDVLQEHLNNDQSNSGTDGYINYNKPSGHPSSLHR